MEVNTYGDTLLPAVAKVAIPEGRLVVLCPHDSSRNFGGLEDLMGVRVPQTATEAARARYIVKFAQDNRSTPIYQPHPSFEWALREGWDQDGNVPFDGTIHLTYPGMQWGGVIPSGAECVAYGEGVYTVASGSYVDSEDIRVVGAQISVTNLNDNGAEDAGKPFYSTTNVVAETIHYDTSTGRLTFKILH